MSRENVQVAVGYYEAAHLADAIEALAEDVKFVFHGKSRSLAGAETISGKESAVAWLRDWFSRFDPEYRMEIEETLDWGDRVVVVTNHKTRGRASGVPISEQTVQVMTLRDGLIVQQDFFASRGEAFEAAGSSE